MSVTIISPAGEFTMSDAQFQRVLALAAISSLRPNSQMDDVLPAPPKQLAAVLDRLAQLDDLDTIIDADARVFSLAVGRAMRNCIGFRDVHLLLQYESGVSKPIEAAPITLNVPEAEIIQTIMSGAVAVSTAAAYTYLSATTEQLSLFVEMEAVAQGPAITFSRAA